MLDKDQSNELLKSLIITTEALKNISEDINDLSDNVMQITSKLDKSIDEQKSIGTSLREKTEALTNNIELLLLKFDSEMIEKQFMLESKRIAIQEKKIDAEIEIQKIKASGETGIVKWSGIIKVMGIIAATFAASYFGTLTKFAGGAK